jgi:hypothetical protein
LVQHVGELQPAHGQNERGGIPRGLRRRPGPRIRAGGAASRFSFSLLRA